MRPAAILAFLVANATATAPSGKTYDLQELCTTVGTADPAEQPSCEDLLYIANDLVPGGKGCAMTWADMCTFDGTTTDHPQGAEANHVQFLYSIGCCTVPICDPVSDCTNNPCSDPSHFRPHNGLDDPHCIGDEIGNPIAQSQSACEGVCLDVGNCCQWDADRPSDPCHCAQEQLCESASVGGTWTPRMWKCGGDMQINQKWESQQSRMAEACCSAEDPTDSTGLHLTSPDAKIIFGPADGQRCELRLMKHPGTSGAGSNYLSSTCEIDGLLST